ncbi:MAG: hypothetical protein K0R57_2927 [Paenibacillaceae bacterium]|jgi:hypothetical protein|nr:hypothetical protein [Paenibacillaceae bacterium]
MDRWIAFVQEQWLVIAVVVIAFVLIVKLVKTAIKWAVIVIILLAVVVYGANYKDTLTSIKEAVVESAGTVADTFKEQAAKAIRDEAKDATYVSNPDGSFTVKGKTVQVDGKPGEDSVRVTIAGQTFTMKLVDAVETFIAEAKKNQ